jgi:isocitrate dehydrogenase
MLTRALKTKAFIAKPTMARAIGHKIKVDNPVVDMDGDEMTKIIWKWIKERVSYLTTYSRVTYLLEFHLFLFSIISTKKI